MRGKIKIGHKIREIRKSLPGKLSMEEFGKLFDPPASKGVVSNWENNYNYPSEERLKLIAELGETTIDEIFSDRDEEETLRKIISDFEVELEKYEILNDMNKFILEICVLSSDRIMDIYKSLAKDDKNKALEILDLFDSEVSEVMHNHADKHEEYMFKIDQLQKSIEYNQRKLDEVLL
ncbi:helix-turn-helix domain-containing protein [Hutsoniella sourekii]|uniref:helix-turn-helix domain-containing protein n=1 Tax=Hutsoniella sourekii TaxID=87650 RepID=UPI0006883B57|nr:helix-turn-helix transcriptional regulator [Hutsoniella sourekii]